MSTETGLELRYESSRARHGARRRRAGAGRVPRWRGRGVEVRESSGAGRCGGNNRSESENKAVSSSAA
ncbi:uncharacterized [Tachysurus ichikawai]